LDGVFNQVDKCITPEIICHPENLKLLKQLVDKETGPINNPFNVGGYFSVYGDLFGIKIIADVNCPRFHQKWEFPKHKYIEYEKSDESWCVPLKIGKWVDTDEPLFYVVDKSPIYGWDKYITTPFGVPKSLLFSSL
jgi:hypothetical protein